MYFTIPCLLKWTRCFTSRPRVEFLKPFTSVRAKALLNPCLCKGKNLTVLWTLTCKIVPCGACLPAPKHGHCWGWPFSLCLGQFYSNGGHSNSGSGGGGGGGGSSGYGSYYQGGDNYNSPVPPKHGGKKQQHGGQQKPSYGSGYQSHQGQQQQSYNQNQYSNYGPPQGKQKGYNHGQGNYSSYSNSYNSPGGGGSDYNYESKFSECWLSLSGE